MKFEEFKYERPELSEVQKQYALYEEKMKACQDADEFMALFKEINQFRGHLSSMMALASLRYTIDTSDEFYVKENEDDRQERRRAENIQRLSGRERYQQLLGR